MDVNEYKVLDNVESAYQELFPSFYSAKAC